MRFFRRDPNRELPPQEHFCKHPDAICGYVYKKLNFSRFEKRLAVITHDGFLVMYKHFLFEVSTGIPLSGRIYDLKRLRHFRIESVDNFVLAHLKTEHNAEITLKLKGNDIQKWAARIMNFKFSSTLPPSRASSFKSSIVTTDAGSGLTSRNNSMKSLTNESDDASTMKAGGAEPDSYSRVSYSLTLRSEDEMSVASGTKSVKSRRHAPGVLDEDTSERLGAGSSELHDLLVESVDSSECRKEEIRDRLDRVVKKHRSMTCSISPAILKRAASIRLQSQLVPKKTLEEA